MFLRNCWYVAAWDHEVTDQLKPVRILGEDIVLYRRTDGAAAALEDACPHRKLPLSMGRIKGDTVECGYHGLTFDSTGTCTRVPGAEKIPHVACVRSYPIAERYGLLWIWMGEAEKADSALIFEVDHWGDPAWGINRGESMLLDCNYLYMTDNLLDPSHVSWVHQSSFGGVQAMEDAPLETTVATDGVTVWRWVVDAAPAPFYAPFLKFSGNCDRKQHYEVRYPSNAIIKAIFVPARTGGEGKPLHADVFLMDSYNFMTPVDENQTKYYWFQMRNFAPDDLEVSRQFATSVRGAFDEDRTNTDRLLRACTAAEVRLSSQTDLLILCKFGKTEVDGGGFRSLIAKALELSVPVLVGVPVINLTPFREFSADLAREIDLSQIVSDPLTAAERLRSSNWPIGEAVVLVERISRLD